MAVDRERRGRVEVVTLNRPEARNALDRATVSGLTSALRDAEHDDDVAAVIITGAGDKVFCAGMDLKEFAGGNGVVGDREAMDAYVTFLRGAFPKPVIAAVNGTAVALATRIGENGPLAVVTTKRLMHEIATHGGADAWQRVGAASPAIFASQDAKEGAMAFAEKRAPQWTGR